MKKGENVPYGRQDDHTKPNSAKQRPWRAHVPTDSCSCSVQAGSRSGKKGCRLWSGPFTSAPPRSPRGRWDRAVVETKHPVPRGQLPPECPQLSLVPKNYDSADYSGLLLQGTHLDFKSFRKSDHGAERDSVDVQLRRGRKHKPSASGSQSGGRALASRVPEGVLG